VTYWEPAKWVAKLRELKTDGNELILKTNMGAGHGGKSGRFESLKETAEEFAFILWQLGWTLPDRKKDNADDGEPLCHDLYRDGRGHR
jgi:hypothetical protein